LHPGHQDIARAWVEMMQASLRPAELLTLNALIAPSDKGVASEAAAYLACSATLQMR